MQVSPHLLLCDAKIVAPAEIIGHSYRSFHFATQMSAEVVVSSGYHAGMLPAASLLTWILIVVA